ncbi:MAG: hypothetical protein CMM01_22725 [Rhodopirellula sp.]|nr:hypothetical protein [Rhodopirellula sp.]
MHPMIQAEFMRGNDVVPTVLRLCFWLAISLWSTSVAEAADYPAFEPVKALFAAMSEKDGKAMQDTSTEDFQLLEHGEEWSMQKLVAVVQANGKPHQRKNFFKQIRTRQTGDMAWVSYWNKAEIQRATELKILVWLESAVMVKVDGKWKIQMLHSTRVEPDRQPKDIEWDPLEETH